MSKPPPDPLFVFHEGMESVFCIIFVVNESNEMIYAGTGDGKVHIWDLKDNRRLKTNKIGDNTCLQLHQTDRGLYVTQEKSGPTTLWREDASRYWTKQRVIASSYVGFCRSVLTQDMWYVVPCGGSVLKIVCLQDENNVGDQCSSEKNPGSELKDTVCCKSGDTEKTLLHKIKGTEQTLCCKNDTEESLCCKLGVTGGTGKNSGFKLGETENSSGNESKNNKETSFSSLGDTLKTIISELETVKHAEEKYLSCKKDEKIGEVMALKAFDKFLLAVYESGELKLWCLVTQKCVSTLNLFDKIKNGDSDCPMAIDFDEKLCRGIVGSSSAELIEFSLEICGGNCDTIKNSTTVFADAKLVKNRTVTMKNPGASCVRIREDGKLFMVGCWDGRIRLYSCKSLKLLVVLDNHRKGNVQDLVFSLKQMKSWTSDNIFASGGLDGRLCLWSVY